MWRTQKKSTARERQMGGSKREKGRREREREMGHAHAQAPPIDETCSFRNDKFNVILNFTGFIRWIWEWYMSTYCWQSKLKWQWQNANTYTHPHIQQKKNIFYACNRWSKARRGNKLNDVKSTIDLGRNANNKMSNDFRHLSIATPHELTNTIEAKWANEFDMGARARKLEQSELGVKKDRYHFETMCDFYFWPYDDCSMYT